MASRMKALNLYKRLLRESQKFHSYNFRMYALRRVKETFRENKTVSDVNRISDLLKFGEENYEMMQRQVMIGHIYGDKPIILEKRSGKSS